MVQNLAVVALIIFNLPVSVDVPKIALAKSLRSWLKNEPPAGDGLTGGKTSWPEELV
jgi:hypothetical protein